MKKVGFKIITERGREERKLFFERNHIIRCKFIETEVDQCSPGTWAGGTEQG